MTRESHVEPGIRPLKFCVLQRDMPGQGRVDVAYKEFSHAMIIVNPLLEITFLCRHYHVCDLTWEKPTCC